MAGVWVLSTRIWRIEIKGNSSLGEDAILEYLSAHNVTYGMPAKEIDNDALELSRNVLRRMHHVNDITPRDFVEVCVDMKQQGVGGYDSWGARPEPFHQIPANRDYQWGFTLVPVRSANQANEAAKYDYR